MADNLDDPKFRKRFILSLLDLLEMALHSLDSAVRVAMLVPDWEKHYEEALNNLALMQHSLDTFAPIRRSVEDVLAGREYGKALDEALQQLKRKPN